MGAKILFSTSNITRALPVTEKTLPKAFSVITSHINISWREQVFCPTKGTGGLQYHKFSIFDGKQHPKKNWFRGY